MGKNNINYKFKIIHMALKSRSGMGAQVKKTERRRNDFLPQASERAPIRGADRKERKPCGVET